ncbi:uncharacterized protein LOC133777448 isoform X3 [Humulus lupulus]|uniref:uncharacterized protein LOC133777448 isoform X3 n=1 Tax=Humulus lupulus TaxID=3486 RepID=UPI002B400F4D|nr:uncharacterized protein LOC133777448 isoform X3 [Humulus lupulus]
MKFIKTICMSCLWITLPNLFVLFFQKYGTVVDVTLPKNPKIAFVTMASPEEALAALNSLQSCPILNLDNDNHNRVDKHSIPFQPSSLVTYQQAFPAIIDNSSHQQSILLGKKILAPQIEVVDLFGTHSDLSHP